MNYLFKTSPSKVEIGDGILLYNGSTIEEKNDFGFWKEVVSIDYACGYYDFKIKWSGELFTTVLHRRDRLVCIKKQKL